MTGKERKIAVVIEHHFDEEEYRYLERRIPELGYRIEYTSHLWGLDELTFNGMGFEEKVVADVEIEDASPEDYAAVILIGGFPGDRLRYQNRFTAVNQSPVASFLRKCNKSGVPVGVLDMAIWVYTAASDLLRGKKVTTSHECVADVVNAGAEIAVGEDKRTVPVHRDGNLITGKGPDHLDAFVATLVDAIDARA